MNNFLFSGEWYLGWKKSELVDISWYQILHWDSLREAQTKHRLSKLLTLYFFFLILYNLKI